MTLRTTLLAIAVSLGALFGLEQCAEARGAADARRDSREAALLTRIRSERALETAATAVADSLKAAQAPNVRAIAQLTDSIARLTARPLPAAPRYVVTPGGTPGALVLVRFAPDTQGYPAHPRVVAALDTFQMRDSLQAVELEARRALEARQNALITQQASENGALRGALAHADSGAVASDQRAHVLAEAARCRWGPWRAFPCLSRTHVALVSVSGTLILEALARTYLPPRL